MGDTKKWITVTFVLSIIIGCAPTLRETRHKETEEKAPPITLPLKTIPSTETFLKITKRYLGIPYKYGGMSRKGVDCSGFVALFYKEVFAISLPHTTKKMIKLGKRVSVSQLKAGDLIFFKGNFFGVVDHVGIYISEGNFIHSSSTEGVIFNNLEEEYYKKHFKEARRILK
ncbi:MAG: C40 family peptidase [Chitinispirillaceae bacterium]|nr:C40 family peptidase [Chitinispirillaceae bacterium]